MALRPYPLWPLVDRLPMREGRRFQLPGFTRRNPCQFLVRVSRVLSKRAQPSPQLHDLNCGRDALAKSGGKATVEPSDDRVNVMTKSSLDLRL